jgi:hypothetical protein
MTTNDASDLAKLDVLDRLNKIEATLNEKDPMMPLHLKNILKQMHTYEELVHLLDDEKIHILMEGMKKYKNIQLVKEITASPRGRKSLKNTSVDDL